jgi:hypothetical protein
MVVPCASLHPGTTIEPNVRFGSKTDTSCLMSEKGGKRTLATERRRLASPMNSHPCLISVRIISLEFWTWHGGRVAGETSRHCLTKFDAA